MKYLSPTGFHTKKDVQIQDGHFKYDFSLVRSELGIFVDRFFGLHGIGSASSNGSTTAYLGRVGKSLHHVFYVFQFQWEKVFMNPDCSRVATLGCKVKLLICSSKVIVSLCGSSYFLVVIYTKG